MFSEWTQPIFFVFAQKNHKGKIIVLYDEDEQIAPRAATIMTERGYTNIFVLSGGKFNLHIAVLAAHEVPQPFTSMRNPMISRSFSLG